MQEESHREIYNPEEGTLDFRKTRATDVKSNPRVKLPKHRTPKEEADLLSRQTRAGEITGDYKSCVGESEPNMMPS